MLELSKLQHEFMQHLLQQDSSIADNIADQGAVPVSTRLGIYGNAYKVRLKSSIENDHEILGAYLGDDLFDLMAEGYTKSKPSHFTSLRDFCEYLPEYLRTTKPFSDHPIISEIAGFERSLLFAFDSANGACATVNDLSEIPQQQWPDLKIRFHPSMQVFHANWNSVQSWQALKADKTPPEQAQDNRDWLIWRNHERITEFRSLAADEYAMMDKFLHGFNFSDVCEALIEFHAEDEVAQNAVQHIMSWLEIGIINKFVY